MRFVVLHVACGVARPLQKGRVQSALQHSACDQVQDEHTVVSWLSPDAQGL